MVPPDGARRQRDGRYPSKGTGAAIPGRRRIKTPPSRPPPRTAMPDDSSQLVIPPSFVALYLPPGRLKPTLPLAELATRHELCEDMAQMLTETARNLEFQLGITPEDVLQRVGQGLRTEPLVVQGPEADWVLGRLAELLGWPLPAPAAPRP